MAELDSSIYGNLKVPEPINLLGMASQAAQMQNALNVNRQFQMQLQARDALAAMIPKYIDKQGNLDNQGLFLGLAQNPATALVGPSIMESIFQAQKMGFDARKASIDATKSQLDLDLQKRGVINATLAAGANDPTIDMDGLRKLAVTSGLYPHVFDANELMSHLKALAGDGAKGPELQQRLKYALAASQTTEAAMKTMLGDIQANENGQWKYYTQTHPLEGSVDLMGGTGGAVRMQMSPPERASPFTYKGPGGEEITTTKGAMDAWQQSDQTRPPPGWPAGTKWTPPQQTAAPIPQPMQGGAVTAPDQTAAPGGISGPSVARQAYVTKVAGNQADAFATLQENAAAAGQSLMQIHEAQRAASQIKMGSGLNAYYSMGGLAQALGASPEVYNGLSGGNRAAIQEFQKYILGLVGAQIRQTFVGAGGVRIAAEYDNLVNAFPNIEMQPEAVQKLLGFMEKMATLKQNELKWYDRKVTHGNMDPASFQEWWQSALQEKGLLGGKDGAPAWADPSKIGIK